LQLRLPGMPMTRVRSPTQPGTIALPETILQRLAAKSRKGEDRTVRKHRPFIALPPLPRGAAASGARVCASHSQNGRRLSMSPNQSAMPTFASQPAMRWPLHSALLGQPVLGGGGQTVRPRGRASAAHTPVPSLRWLGCIPCQPPRQPTSRSLREEGRGRARRRGRQGASATEMATLEWESTRTMLVTATCVLGSRRLPVPIVGLGPQLQRILLHAFANPYTGDLHLVVY
jgi:hypothetical protein